MNLPTQVHTITLLRQSTLLVLVCLITLAFTFTILLDLKSEIADEGFHAPQIWEFYHGNMRAIKELTVLPTYHFIVASLLQTYGQYSVVVCRLITILLSALSLPLFFILCHRWYSEQADLRTMLFLTFPIILPFFSLIYTDMPALVFLLVMYCLAIRKYHWLAGIFALLAIAMRQSNIIWVVYCSLLVVFQANDYKFNKKWTHSLTDLLPYLLSCMITCVYFAINKSYVLGDEQLHKISFNLSNLYFFLLLWFLLLLPIHLSYVSRIVKLMWHSTRVKIFLCAGFIVFFLTYSNDHQYNSIGLDFYLRNILLHYTVSNITLKILAYIAISWAGLTLAIQFIDSQHKLELGAAYIFTIISLVPLPLIEQRYYIPAIAVLLALAPIKSNATLKLILLIYVPINCWILYGISQHRFFL